ncbi:dicarboxylate/amino acid:cation symporter [Sphingomonas sp.]|uniref:dicarboxylate/amino acid:cation symporter n=1 Tax=Sphingomonas sp. TaxID=28214 RepID=UPI002C6680EB|nr:dicarboxylate/amino acid:cation symporter [Sphingomonas sp.]HTG39618.1 dicarboxylate/amino acid:cation symporter [Sphingomonas sp.]
MAAFARRWFAVPLWQRVLAGLVVGVAIGLFAPGVAPWIAFVGELFVRLIRMLVVPIVFVSIAAGVTALGDPRRLGSVGGRTVALFAFTTACAVSVGMALALLLEPGSGAMLGNAVPHALGEPKSLHDQLIGIVPVNIVQSLAEGDMLAIIFFAILFGFGVILAGDEGRPMATILASAGRVLFHLVRIVMEFTPFGVLALIAKAVADNGVAVFTNIGWLALCVVLGVVVQMALVHLPLIRLVARLSIRRFFRAAADPLLVAFSTASSAATLPVALRVAQERLRIDTAIASTVLPIGASIGKDGTAMYVGLISVFSLQALGIAADPAMLAIMLLTGSLAAFGTAPIPSASLFMLAAVLSAVGVSPEQTALVVGLILPFDRLLDMTRTVASASANLTVTAVVARREGAIGPL